MYRLVEQLAQLCNFTYATYDPVFPNCLRSERNVSRICVPNLVYVTGRKTLTPSSDFLGTKELSWQGRMPFQGYLRRDSVVLQATVREKIARWSGATEGT